MPLSVVEVTHAAWAGAVAVGEACVDATAGNGRDAVALARLVGDGGHVYAIDTLPAAVERTRNLLAAEGLLERVTVLEAGHESAHAVVKEILDVGVAAIAFNLGYLPGWHGATRTEAATTLRALDGFWPLLREGGVLTVVAYSGHPGGEAERDAVERWAVDRARVDARVARYHPIGTRSPAPEAFLLWKSRSSGRSERNGDMVE